MKKHEQTRLKQHIWLLAFKNSPKSNLKPKTLDDIAGLVQK